MKPTTESSRSGLTVLSNMAGHKLSDQLDQAGRWGLTTLDFKTVFDKNIADLTDAEVEELAVALTESHIGVQAFSTHLFKLKVEAGEAAFAAQLALLDRVLVIARRLRPQAIRLIAAETLRRAEIPDSWRYLREEQPWLLPLYAEAVDRIHAAGFQTVIENEVDGCIFSTPGEIVDFFTALGRRDKVGFTWDVQNLWQMGTFPTMEVYQQLRPYVDYLHLKGGIAGDDGRTLQWRSGLEAASWPVLAITRAALTNGVRYGLCLNPSHGARHPDSSGEGTYDRDLAFLRREFTAHLLP